MACPSGGTAFKSAPIHWRNATPARPKRAGGRPGVAAARPPPPLAQPAGGLCVPGRGLRRPVSGDSSHSSPMTGGNRWACGWRNGGGGRGRRGMEAEVEKHTSMLGGKVSPGLPPLPSPPDPPCRLAALRWSFPPHRCIHQCPHFTAEGGRQPLPGPAAPRPPRPLSRCHPLRRGLWLGVGPFPRSAECACPRLPARSPPETHLFQVRMR